MKRFGGLLGTLVLIALSVSPQTAYASPCSNISTYGTVQLTVPTLPKTGSYVIWLRMQSVDDSARLLLEVNQQSCLILAADDVTPDQWFWQPYQENSITKAYEFTAKENNNLLLVGVDDGVKVDKVVVAAPDCIPEEFGDNCNTSITAQAASSRDVLSLPAPSQDAVSGSVQLSVTPDRNEAILKELRYVVSGKTLQRSTTAEAFDTTLVPNGKHAILIETELVDGTILKESTVIDVDNTETILSPVIRWVRIHQQTVILLAKGTAVLLAFIILLYLLRAWYLRRRELKFRGF